MDDMGKEIALAMVGEALEHFVNHRFDKCIELLSRAIELDPHSRRAFLSRGAAHLRLKKNQDAIDDFNHVIDLDDKLARAYHLRGLAYHQAGNRLHALKDFKRVVEMDPEYGRAYRIDVSYRKDAGPASPAKKGN